MLKYEFAEKCYSPRYGPGVIIKKMGFRVLVAFRDHTEPMVVEKQDIQKESTVPMYTITVEESLDVDGLFVAKFSDLKNTKFVGTTPQDAINSAYKGGYRNV